MTRSQDRRSVALMTMSARAIACIAGLACTQSAFAQLATNIIPELRPLVNVQFPAAPTAAGARTVSLLGFLDTGSQTTVISPQVNSLLGLPSVPAGGPGQPAIPNASVAVRADVSGLLGMRLAGPEVLNGANTTHQLTSSTTGLGATTASRTFNAQLSYFTNAQGNVLNWMPIGQNFLAAGPAGGDGGRVLVVDPTTAFAAPFNFSNFSPDPAVPALVRSNGVVDYRSSSLTFTAPGSAAVSTAAINLNPNWVTFLPFRTPPAGGYVNEQVGAAGRGATFAPDPSMTFDATTTAWINNLLGRGGVGQPAAFPAPNNAGGAAQVNWIADTGAPGSFSSALPGGGTEVVLGTDFLNRFGQQFDYTGANPGVLLSAPRQRGDQELLGRGMLMTVGRGSQGAAGSGVAQMRLAGPQASMRFNTTISPADTGAEVPDQAGIGIYRAHGSSMNTTYIGGRDAMGLQAGANGDQIDGMKLGADQIGRSFASLAFNSRQESMVFFSVSVDSQGLANGDGNLTIGGGVNRQNALGQAAGDIFLSTTPRARNRINFNTPENGTNNLRINQDVLGLQGNAGPLASAAGRGNIDNLRDFDLRPELGMVDSSRALRNVDPVIRSVGDTRNPMSAAETGALAARTDVFQQTFSTYYSLTSNSATVAADGTSGAHIYTTSNAGLPTVWATPDQYGLLDGDDIDAFSLQRVYDAGFGLAPSSLGPFEGGAAILQGLIAGRYDQNQNEDYRNITFGYNNDLMIFSLAPGSASLLLTDNFLGRRLSAADLFITDFDGTFSLWASAESLGLRPGDNIDGLDVTAIPAPSVAALLGMLGIAASRRRRA